MTQARTKLKLCPFCGECRTEVEFHGRTCFRKCKACGATGPREIFGHGGSSDIAWNTRAPLYKAAPDLLAALENAVGCCSRCGGKGKYYDVSESVRVGPEIECGKCTPWHAAIAAAREG